MTDNKPVKSSTSKRYSVSKRKLAENANAMQQAAAEAAIIGEEHAIQGAERLDAAAELSEVGNVLTAQGASDLTRAVDAKVVSDRLDVLSGAVAAAGVVDIAEGAAILAASDDVNVLSALVGMASEGDIEDALAMARISGELRAASDILAELRMPVFAKFLADRSEKLHDMSVKEVHDAVASKGVSELMESAGARIGDLGENEVMEGVTRLDVAAAGAARAEAMAKASKELAEKGVEEIIVAGEVEKAAQEEALKGAKEIAAGSIVVGEAIAYDQMADNLKKKSK